jgi:hypothetical protein
MEPAHGERIVVMKDSHSRKGRAVVVEKEGQCGPTIPRVKPSVEPRS